MRFCLVYIAVLSNLVVLSSSTNCENPFTASFVAIIDQTSDQPLTSTTDLNITFFKDVLKFNDVEIDLVIDECC